MTDRSDLELAVLGFIWKTGPITPYAVRREFLNSPTPHFGGSAGAIYPLVKRLERDGLLVSEAARQGKRRSRQYRVTPAGTAELRRWLRPPIPPADAGPSLDLVRTRLHFLGALTKKQRAAFLEDAIAALEARLPNLEAREARYVESGDPYGRLATEGSRRVHECRIAWLKSVRRSLEEQGLA